MHRSETFTEKGRLWHIGLIVQRVLWRGVKISMPTCRRGYSEKANEAITEILSRKEPLKRYHMRMIVYILFSETLYPDDNTL